MADNTDNTEQILRPRRRRWVAIATLGILFAVGGALMVRDERAVGWLVCVFFALVAVVAIVNMIPGASYLKLSPDGFTVCSLFRSWSLRWDDVQRFFVARVGANKMVLFDFTDAYQGSRRGRAVSKAVSGADGGLPDSYDRTPEALAALMNEYKDRSGGDPAPR